MSSSTITVNPRRRPARSPPPAAKTEDTTPKETVLLRNPLPKYSFQQNLDKKKAEKDSPNKMDKVDNKSPADKEINLSKVKLELQTSEPASADKDVPKPDPIRDKSDPNNDLRIGVLVNSFPQNTGSITFVDQSAELQTSVNQGETQKKASSNIEAEVVKTMIDKLKPVNIVDPITCTGSSNSGTQLAHSYSESAISSPSSGFYPRQQEQNLTRVQVSASILPETSLLVQGQTDAQSVADDLSVIEALAGNDAETSGMAPSLSGDAIVSNCQYKDKIRQLEEEKQLLKQQLEVQLQVN